MSLAKMKEAIIKNPTKELIEAYESITGEKLNLSTTPEPEIPVVKRKPGRPKKIRPVETPIEPEIEDDEEEQEEIPDFIFQAQKPKTKNRSGSKQTPMRVVSFEKPKKFNHFDDGELKQDVLVNKEGKPIPCPTTPRLREKFQKIIVRCRKCGNEDEVSPSLAPNPRRYVCNECSRG